MSNTATNRGVCREAPGIARVCQKSKQMQNFQGYGCMALLVSLYGWLFNSYSNVKLIITKAQSQALDKALFLEQPLIWTQLSPIGHNS